MNEYLFLIDRIEKGGAEKVLLRIAEQIANKGKIHIFSNFDVGGYIPIEIQQNERIVLHKLGIKERKNLASKVFSLILYILKVYRLSKRGQYSKSLSFLERSNIANVILGKLLDFKPIVSVRNNLSYQYEDRRRIENFLVKKLISFIYNNGNVIICLSESVKYDLIENFFVKKEKLKVIYNPYNIAKIREYADIPLTKEYSDIFKNNLVCITMGRYTFQKGHWHLIRSFRIIKSKIKNIKLVILGDGELKTILKKIIKVHNLEDDVFLIPFQSNPYSFLKKAQVFLFSSLFEGFGNAIVEAMVCGLPVVSTNCKFGPSEIILNKSYFHIDTSIYGDYGILLPEFKNQKILIDEELTKEEYFYAEEITKLLQNKNLLKKYANKSILRGSQFDIDNIIRKWDDLF